MKNVILTLLFSFVSLQCFAIGTSPVSVALSASKGHVSGGSPTQTATGSLGVCLWAIPSKQMWINLYMVESIAVEKNGGYSSFYNYSTNVIINKKTFEILIAKNESTDIHMRAIEKRIAECRNPN